MWSGTCTWDFRDVMENLCGAPSWYAGFFRSTGILRLWSNGISVFENRFLPFKWFCYPLCLNAPLPILCLLWCWKLHTSHPIISISFYTFFVNGSWPIFISILLKSSFPYIFRLSYQQCLFLKTRPPLALEPFWNWNLDCAGSAKQSS